MVRSDQKLDSNNGNGASMFKGVINYRYTDRDGKKQGCVKFSSPPEYLNAEASFFYSDVDLFGKSKDLLEPGMKVRFQLIIDSLTKELHAKKIQPEDPAEYQASVIRVPAPKNYGHGFVVRIDSTMKLFNVSADSYNALKLEELASIGDSCIVKVAWTEVVVAAYEERLPFCDIVQLLPRPPRVSCEGEYLTRKQTRIAQQDQSKSPKSRRNQMLRFSCHPYRKPLGSKWSVPAQRSPSWGQHLNSSNQSSNQVPIDPRMIMSDIPLNTYPSNFGQRQVPHNNGLTYDNNRFSPFTLPSFASPSYFQRSIIFNNRLCQPTFSSMKFPGPQGFVAYSCIN